MTDDDKEKYLELLSASQERAASLAACQQSLAMLKEMTSATIAAYREELQRAARERICAETDLVISMERAKAQIQAQQRERETELRKWYGRFAALYNGLAALVAALPAFDQHCALEDAKGPLASALAEAREVLTVAAEYLD